MAELDKSNMQAANQHYILLAFHLPGQLELRLPVQLDVITKEKDAAVTLPLHTDSWLRLLSFVILLCTLVSIF